MLYLQHSGSVFPVAPDGRIITPPRQTPGFIVGAVTVAKNGRGCAQAWTWDQIKHSPESVPWFWENGRQRTFLQVHVHGRDVALEWRQQCTFVFQHEEKV